MISPFDAWAVKRALVGHDLTDTLPGVSRMLRPVVEYLGTLPSAEARGIAWQALVRIRPFREQLVSAVDEADPGRLSRGGCRPADTLDESEGRERGRENPDVRIHQQF